MKKQAPGSPVRTEFRDRIAKIAVKPAANIEFAGCEIVGFDCLVNWCSIKQPIYGPMVYHWSSGPFTAEYGPSEIRMSINEKSIFSVHGYVNFTWNKQ